MALPNAAYSTGYGLVINCVQANVSKPKVVNAVPTLPGATCTLLNGAAAAEFLTLIVKYPVVLTVANTFGTVALIALARLVTVVPVSATSMLLTLSVLPAVSTGLATVAVIVPYTRLWFTKRSTTPPLKICWLLCGSPTYKLQLLSQISTA